MASIFTHLLISSKLNLILSYFPHFLLTLWAIFTDKCLAVFILSDHQKNSTQIKILKWWAYALLVGKNNILITPKYIKCNYFIENFLVQKLFLMSSPSAFYFKWRKWNKHQKMLANKIAIIRFKIERAVCRIVCKIF